jgi:signal peptidase I
MGAMTGRSLIWRIAGVFAAITILFVAWLELAPSQLGGSVSYVAVVGSSMKPRLHGGDLVLIRSTSEHRVGDITAYRSRDLGRTVLHRIIRREGTRYVFKGDNNSYMDPERPVRSQLLGKLWLRIPLAGSALAWVRQPLHASVLAAAVALLLSLWGTGATRRMPRLRGRRAEHAFLVLAGVASLFALLAVWAFKSPASRTVEWPDLYRQSGRFSYAATVEPGPVYRSGRVTTGQPIFLELARTVRLRFHYRFSSAAPHAVGGTSRLLVELRGSNGWQRTLLLQPERPFSGDLVSVGGTLDLRALLKLTHDVERLTGSSSAGYTVSVVPEIRLHGSVANQRIDEAFAPALPLRLDPFELQLDTAAVGGQVAALRPTKPGRGSRAEANRLRILGVSVAVPDARRAALLGLGIVLIALLLAALVWRRGRLLDDSALLEDEYGPLVVDALARRSPQRVVEVKTMDGLLRLAKHYECVILRSFERDETIYAVETGGIAYLFRAAATTYGWERDNEPTEVFPLDRRLRALPARSEAQRA